MGLSLLKITGTGTGTSLRSIFRSLIWYRGAPMVSIVNTSAEAQVSSSSHSPFSSSSLPLLMLSPSSCGSRSYDLYSFAKNRVFTIPKPGWLPCFNYRLFLYNPLSGRRVNLPPGGAMMLFNTTSYCFPGINSTFDAKSELEAWDLRNPMSPQIPLGRHESQMSMSSDAKYKAVTTRLGSNRHNSMPLFNHNRCLPRHPRSSRHVATFIGKHNCPCPHCRTPEGQLLWFRPEKGLVPGTMEYHFSEEHKEIHKVAKPQKLICKCGICFTDRPALEDHKRNCYFLRWHFPPYGSYTLNSDASCKQISESEDESENESESTVHPPENAKENEIKEGENANESESTVHPPENAKKNENEEGETGAGGLIRDCWGLCLGTYVEFLGVSTPMFAELNALVRCLLHARTIGLKKLIVQTDCLEVFQMLENSYKWSPENVLLYIYEKSESSAYRQQLRIATNILKDPNVQYTVLHVFRESNKPADALAKEALVQKKIKLLLFGDLSSKIQGFIISDSRKAARDFE